MIIKLLKLEYSNFKMFKYFELNLEGKNCTIEGKNATGKTSVVDGFQWLLFDKNSDGNSKFSAKPLNKDGTEKHHLETSVMIILEVDGHPLKLKKILKEKWVTKRGETEQEFSGHTTEYEINDSPKSQKDYKAKIDEILNEDVFKMITNVHYFNNLKTDEKRKLIMSLSQAISNEDVALHDEEFIPLVKRLQNKTINDLEAEFKRDRLKLNDSLKTLPARIDELSKIDFSSVENSTIEEIMALINDTNNKLQEIQAKKANLSANGEIINLESEIRRMQADKAQLAVFHSTKQDKIQNIRMEMLAIQSEKNNFDMKISTLENEIRNIKSTVDAKTKNKEDLLKQYHEEREKVFTANACAYCGQALPAEKVEELEKHFNSHKVEILGKITAEGKQLASEIDTLIKSGTSKEEEIKSLKEEIIELSVKYQNKLVELDRVINELEINPNQDKIDELVARMHQTQEQLNALKMGYVVNPYEQEERQLNDLMGELHMKMAKLNQKIETVSRIETLKTQVDSYKKQLADTEKMLILIDKFNLKKVELQEQGINGQFELVKFKLFDIQINGGINPVCVATVNGVPYPDLNNAMKINAGLDIIRSLQKIYNVKAPIFVDNAESVNKLIDLDDTQFVKLYVTEDDQIKMYVEE